MARAWIERHHLAPCQPMGREQGCCGALGFLAGEKVQFRAGVDDAEGGQGLQVVCHGMNDPPPRLVVDQDTAGKGGRSNEPGLEIAPLIVDDQVVTVSTKPLPQPEPCRK